MIIEGRGNLGNDSRNDPLALQTYSLRLSKGTHVRANANFPGIDPAEGNAVKRVARQPTRLGALDLAAKIGQELNVPLDRISEVFSFDEATKLGIENIRLLIGRRAEKMFEYVLASLGKAELIHQEDAVGPLYAGAEVQAPDYFVAHKTGERYFVEVKHARKESFNEPVNFSGKFCAIWEMGLPLHRRSRP